MTPAKNFHLWHTHDYGTSCVRCGLFSYVASDNEKCSGKLDQTNLADIDKRIKLLTTNKDILLSIIEASKAVE